MAFDRVRLGRNQGLGTRNRGTGGLGMRGFRVMGFRVLQGMLKLKKPVSVRFNYVNYVVSHSVLGSTVSGIRCCGSSTI